MRKFVAVIFVTLLFTTFASAQTKPKPKPRPTPAKAAPSVDKGTVSGRTYTNKTFRFEVTFPDTWQISLANTQLDTIVKNVTVLLNVHRSTKSKTDNATIRISVEDLSPNPQVKDAVDYFDAIRSSYGSMKLPADFKYSETQAEQLGAMQFGYLDTSTAGGKKRMYATVRDGFAVMFTISYSKDADLQTLRSVIEQGNFRLK